MPKFISQKFYGQTLMLHISTGRLNFLVERLGSLEKLINSNFGLRLLSSLSLISVFVYAIIYNDSLFLLLMFISSVLALFELAKMQQLKFLMILFNIFSLIFLYVLSTYNLQFFIYIIIFLFCFLFPLIPFLKTKEFFLNIALAFYIPSFFIALIILIPDHKLIVLFTFLGIWAVDVGGYLFGKSFGKHKIFPITSPKKTYEGLLGSLVFLSLIQSVSWHFFDIFSLIEFLVISFLISVGSIYGDYFESFLKRKYHIKDSGNLIPGHGGLLDRLDSAIYTIPLITILCLVIIN